MEIGNYVKAIKLPEDSFYLQVMGTITADRNVLEIIYYDENGEKYIARAEDIGKRHIYIKNHQEMLKYEIERLTPFLLRLFI